jgi:hypothetical protein
MGTKHKHYDVIVAWSAGEEIEFLWDGEWEEYTESCPSFLASQEWRVKPKIVKREGWVNVYYISKAEYKAYIHATKEIADEKATSYRKACVRIEWEEEE